MITNEGIEIVDNIKLIDITRETQPQIIDVVDLEQKERKRKLDKQAVLGAWVGGLGMVLSVLLLIASWLMFGYAL